MKKYLFGTVLSILTLVVPISAMASVDVQIGVGVPFPPAIVFPAPPALIVIPDTYVYAVPDIDEDIYFYNGWWWRPWEGRWYRSQYYNRGWTYYKGVPGFYYNIDPHWRGYYRSRNWNGHRWNYERIPQQKLQKNWKSWKNNRYWERHGSWGVQGYQPLPQQRKRELRKQREEQYRQAPPGTVSTPAGAAAAESTSNQAADSLGTATARAADSLGKAPASAGAARVGATSAASTAASATAAGYGASAEQA